MTDHNKKTLTRIYFQYKNAPKLIEYILSIPDIANSQLEDQIVKIKAILDIDISEGEQLDICGRIAGYRRRPVGKLYPDCVYKEVTDDLYRKLIKSKIFKNNTLATIDEIKNAADYILGIETTVLDGQNMNMRLVWADDEIDIVTQQLVVDYDLIPRPQGVGTLDHRVLSYVPFGFGEYNQNFNNSTFWWGDGIHINFYASIIMSFDNDTATLSGTVITNEGVLVNNADILLNYVDSKGNEFSSRVVTDANGVFNDVVKDTGNYTVTAKTQVLTPLCKMMDVETPFTFIYRISVASITPSVSYLELISNETKTFTVDVLPENADNRGFTVTSSDESIAKVEVLNGIVNVVGLNPGTATLTVIADDNGISATVAIGVVSATQFVMRIDAVDRPLFYANTAEPITIDYGDGIDSTDYRVIEDSLTTGYGWVLTTRDLNIGEDYTITVKRSDTIRFFGSGTGTTYVFNTLREIIRVSSARTSMSSFARANTGLYKIHDNAFQYLSSVTSFEAAFYGCTSLLTLPDRLFDPCPNVTTFAQALFGCTNLTLLPDGLFSKCKLVTTFLQAFSNCSGLLKIPDGLFSGLVNVTTYQNVFYGCSSLTTTPSNLFSDGLNVTTFYGAFQACTKLVTIGNGIFKNCSAASNFYYVFGSCTALTTIPDALFADCSSALTFQGAFYNCQSLASLPQGMFTAIAGGNFTQTFYNCKSLTSVPDSMFEGLKGASTFTETFSGCSGIKTVGAAVFKNCSAATIFSNTFYNCSALVSVGSDIFSGCTSVTTFAYVFYGCVALTNMPLFTDCNKITTIQYSFYNCKSLVEITPYAFDGKTLLSNAARAFQLCSGLKTIPTGVFRGCYALASLQYTFQGCSGLVSLPGGIFEGCSKVTDIQYLFNTCSNLITLAPTLFDGLSGAISTSLSLFGKCTSLVEIPAGLFDPMINITSLQSTFLDCSKLQVIPSGLFKYNTKLVTATGLFSSCDLRNIPEDILENCHLITSFSSAFSFNTYLVDIPRNLFANNINATDFTYILSATGITNVPAGLFENNVKATTFMYAFQSCPNLVSVADGLFNNTAATTLYYAFNSCGNLTSNINSIFNLTSYPTITNVSRLFGNCVLATGSGLSLIAALPNATTHVSTFNLATSLTDYNQIPAAWGGGGS